MKSIIKLLAIALVTCSFSAPASAMDAPKVAVSKIAIIQAARSGTLTTLKKLLRTDISYVDNTDANGCTALMYAARNGHVDCVRALIGANATVDQASNDGTTALMCAADKGQHDCVQALIHANATVDQVDKNGRTGLMNAVLNGHLNCVNELIKAKAQVDQIDNDGTTALMNAATMDHPDCVKALITAGAKVNRKHKTTGTTALIFAAHTGHLGCVQALINSGANIHLTGTDHYTALGHAAKKGHHECIRALLAAGADAAHAFRVAIDIGDFAAVKNLIANGVNVETKIYAEAPPRAGNSGAAQALPLAQTNTLQGYTDSKKEVVKSLLENRATVNSTANNGLTPLMVAALKESSGKLQESLVNLLTRDTNK